MATIKKDIKNENDIIINIFIYRGDLGGAEKQKLIKKEIEKYNKIVEKNKEKNIDNQKK